MSLLDRAVAQGAGGFVVHVLGLAFAVALAGFYTNARFSCISDFEPALNFRRCSLFTSATSARQGRLVLHPRTYRCLAARQSSGPSLDTRVRIGIARQPADKLVAVIPTQRKGESARAGTGARRLSILIFMPTAVRLGSRSAHISS